MTEADHETISVPKHIFSKRIIYRHRYSINSLIDDYLSLSVRILGSTVELRVRISSEFAQLTIINQNLIFHRIHIKADSGAAEKVTTKTSTSIEMTPDDKKRRKLIFIILCNSEIFQSVCWKVNLLLLNNQRGEFKSEKYWNRSTPNWILNWI